MYIFDLIIVRHRGYVVPIVHIVVVQRTVVAIEVPRVVGIVT